MPKHWIAGLTIVALVHMLPSFAAQPAAPAQKGGLVEPDDAVRMVLRSLESAIASKNIDSALAQFTDDGLFIDQAGDEIRGQAALHERFNQLLKVDPQPTIGIHPETITFPATNVALTVGEVSRKLGKHDSPVSRFTIVMLKRNNTWKISELTETAMHASQVESHLQDLSWLIGSWSSSKPDATAQLDVEWAPNKKFMTSKYSFKKPGVEQQIDTQMIGWDPQHDSIVSWHFDSNGGFGSGIWSKHPSEDQWTVQVAGVGADGSNTVVSNIFTLKTPDEFVWQSIHRSIDGITVADTEPITVHRVKR
jgi:uncharacterized protein (TIGR02246 family)